MDLNMFGRRRHDNADRPVRLNQMDEVLVAQGLPSYAELSLRGNGWTCVTETLFDAVAAYPTTVAELEVYNNTTDQVLIIADLFAAEVLATDADQTYAIMAMVTTQKAAPTLAALELYSLSGKAPITPTAAGTIVTGAGTTVVANGWRPFGERSSFGNAAATPGGAWHAEVNGKLIVPPKCSLAVSIMGSLATASAFQCGTTFYIEKLSTTFY